MQWRRMTEPDALDSGDEAQRSGEDSELEGDGGLRCCIATPAMSAGGVDDTGFDTQ